MAKFSNRERLLQKMAALPPATRSAIKQALAQSADEIVFEQKRAAPFDDGDLKNSIGSTFGTYKPANSNVRGASAGTRGGDPDLTVTIHAGDAKAFYAAFVEFGTKGHVAGGKFKGAWIPAIPPRPFFYPVFRAYRKRAMSRINRAITRSVKQTVGGGTP